MPLFRLIALLAVVGAFFARRRRRAVEPVDPLVIAYLAGAGIRGIARSFGIELGEVVDHLTRELISQEGASDDERHAIRARRVYRADEREAIDRMYADGYSLTWIALAVGRSERAVAWQLIERGTAREVRGAPRIRPRAEQAVGDERVASDTATLIWHLARGGEVERALAGGGADLAFNPRAAGVRVRAMRARAALRDRAARPQRRAARRRPRGMTREAAERIAGDAIEWSLDELARGHPAEVDWPRLAYERAVEDLRLGPANAMNAGRHR